LTVIFQNDICLINIKNKDNLHKNEEFCEELTLLYQSFKKIDLNIKIDKFGFYKIKIYWSYDQKCIIL